MRPSPQKMVAITTKESIIGGITMERHLELTIRINETNVEVEIYEPESGEFTQIETPFSPGEHSKFDQAIGNEIYSWISLWKNAEDEDTTNADAGCEEVVHIIGAKLDEHRKDQGDVI